MLFMYHDSAFRLMNKILSSVLYTFLSCPALLCKAGSHDTALGQSALQENINSVHLAQWAWAPIMLYIYAFVGKLSLFITNFPYTLFTCYQTTPSAK